MRTYADAKRYMRKPDPEEEDDENLENEPENEAEEQAADDYAQSGWGAWQER